MTEDVKCPKCGSETIIRTSKKSPDAGRKYYVCARFPDCKGRIPVQNSGMIKSDTNLVAIASLICGIGSFCTVVISAGFFMFSCWDSGWNGGFIIPIAVCFCLAIMSFILGIVALKDKMHRRQQHLALVGISFGAISSILQILAWVFGSRYCF